MGRPKTHRFTESQSPTKVDPGLECLPAGRGPWTTLGQRSARTCLCFGGTFRSLEKSPRGAARAGGRRSGRRRESVSGPQCPRAADPRGARGGTGPRRRPRCRARGAAAGSDTRPRVRHQLQVPREQAQQVPDDGGFVAPRRVLEPGKEAERGSGRNASRRNPAAALPARAPTPGRSHPTRSPPASTRGTARSTHSCPRFGTPPGRPEGLPRGAWLHQLELERGQEVNESGGGSGLPATARSTLPARTQARTQGPREDANRACTVWGPGGPARGSCALPVGQSVRSDPGAAGPGAGDTHAGRHIAPRGRQQLQGRADAGEQLGARQAPQHGLGVREAPRHQPQPGARLRGPDGVREARARDTRPPTRAGPRASPRAAAGPSSGGRSSCAASSSAFPPPAGQGLA